MAEEVLQCQKLMVVTEKENAVMIKALRYVGFEMAPSMMINYDVSRFTLLTYEL
jgi:RimJ/RimL family protein N-acetyltransferase